MNYINMMHRGKKETIDQFDTFTEARKMVTEYQMSDPASSYYISKRCCKGWK